MVQHIVTFEILGNDWALYSKLPMPDPLNQSHRGHLTNDDAVCEHIANTLQTKATHRYAIFFNVSVKCIVLFTCH